MKFKNEYLKAIRQYHETNLAVGGIVMISYGGMLIVHEILYSSGPWVFFTGVFLMMIGSTLFG